MSLNLKKLFSIALIMSTSAFLGSCCVRPSSEKSMIMPKVNGTTEEKISYHQKEIYKYQAKIEEQERIAQRALSRQDMETAREAQNRKMQYQRKIDKHAEKIHELREKEQKHEK